jgi:hypothetical protein
LFVAVVGHETIGAAVVAAAVRGIVNQKWVSGEK